MKPHQLENIIHKTRYARNYLDAGHCIVSVARDLEESPKTIRNYLEKYAEPLNSHETLADSRFFKSLVPIYVFPAPNAETLEPAPEFSGTGLLININARLFLVTAAHVVPTEPDAVIAIRMSDGGIYSIGQPGFAACRGHYPGTHRDTIDVAAFDLTDMKQTPINEFYSPLELLDINFNEDNIDGQVLTVAGYPADLHVKGAPAKPVALTGYGDNILPIRKYRYTEETNTCVRFSMKSSKNRGREKLISRNPVGMSGGAILSWPTSFEKRQNGGELKLIGIVHTWEKKIHTLCGTRMATVIGTIARVYPQHFSTD